MWISIKNSDQVIWLAGIRSRRGILIYSAWQGLNGLKLGGRTCRYKLSGIWYGKPHFPKTYLLTCAPSEDSDQFAHSCSLIRIFTGRILDSQGCNVSSCGQRRLIRLCGCSGWTESSLDAHVRRYVFSCCRSNIKGSLSSFSYPASILYKSIAGRYRPVRVADGPITARYRFKKNASWDSLLFDTVYADNEGPDQLSRETWGPDLRPTFFFIN